jgi:GR25 family glycosyltransferase involved in LPS biosynthesis
MSVPPIYVISYNNNKRKEKMIERFEKLNIQNVTYLPGVGMDDIRITSLKDREKYDKVEHKVWATMLAHMDAINKFYYDTKDNICIICEDDIHILRDFSRVIQQTTNEFIKMELDILLLGYLLPLKIELEPDKYFYFQYSWDMWGCQMYMISRSYAKFLIDKCTIEFAYNTIGILPYSSDWIITKNGKRRMIYPMLAVEEGIIIGSSEDHTSFHKKCHDINYNEKLYL